MTLKHVRECLEKGDIRGAVSALDGYELRMASARSKGGSVKSKAKSEAAKRRWGARIKGAINGGLVGMERDLAKSLGIDPDNPDPSGKLRTSKIGAWMDTPDSVPLAEENYSGSGGAVPEDLKQEAFDVALEAMSDKARPMKDRIRAAEYLADSTKGVDVIVTGPALKLPHGVMKGSQLEGRG